MSGLQASISTHIARTYYYPDGHWGYNIPLFVRAVGSHPDRLSNLYFTFLFVLRAVVKAGSTLSEYPFHTGKQDDDEKVRDLIRRLVEARVPRMFPKGFAKKAAGDAVKAVKKMAGKKIEDIANSTQTNSSDLDDYGTELEQCRNGFDESVLFQVRICCTKLT